MTPDKSTTPDRVRPSLPVPPSPPPERLALRLDEVAAALGISRRTIERLRSAGRFPEPDRFIGKAPVWSPATIRRWVEVGGE